MSTNDDKTPVVQAVDLFCGIGGLTHGLQLSGVAVKAGIDIDASCRYAYEVNNAGSEFISADVRQLDAAEIISRYEDADVTVLAGCAPCQPFSAHNRKAAQPRRPGDCSLLKEFGRLVKECGPDIVSMENVPGLTRHEAFEEFVSLLHELGYRCNHEVLTCSDYGIPQTRKRLVLLASRLGDIRLPPPTGETVTVVEVLKGLPAIKDGHSAPDDPAHVSPPLSARNRRRIRQSRPGGTWKDWREEDISECQKHAYYPAPYGRMCWDALAPTLTTQFCYYSTGRFGHPEQHRAISVREGALLQTFPSDYALVEEGQGIAVSTLAQHVGNAVPVQLAKAIGRSIMEGASG